MNLALFAGSLLGAIVLVILLAVAFVRFYSEGRNGSKALTLVSALAISVTLFCCLLIPVDIYTVSSSLTINGAQIDPKLVIDVGAVMKYIYYGFYSVMLALAFVVMPFFYFYYEEETEGGSEAARICGACKYTVAFIVVFAVLLILGAVLKSNGGEQSADWIKDLSSQFGTGDSLMAFSVGSLCMFGLTAWISYTACGLASVPVRLCKHRPQVAAAIGIDTKHLIQNDSVNETQVETKLELNQENQKYLQGKYTGQSVTEWSKEDRREHTRLRVEERSLKDLSAQGQEVKATGGDAFNRCWNVLAPIRCALGILLLLVSLLLIVSMLISTVDRLINSKCKLKCGFALEKHSFPNPIDATLGFVSRAFPVDFIVFAGLVFYIFLCSAQGMVSLGVRLCGFKLFTIRRRRTMPHALLMGSWLLMFCSLVLNLQILTLAPQYATFGTQFYMDTNTTNTTLLSLHTTTSIDSPTIASPLHAPMHLRHYPSLSIPDLVEPHGTREDIRRMETQSSTKRHAEHQTLSNAAKEGKKIPCSLAQQGVDGRCHMTQVALFINQLQVQLPFIGGVLFMSNLLFLLAFFLFVVVAACKREGKESERDEEEDIWGGAF